MRINKWNGLVPATGGLSTIIDDIFSSSFSDLVQSDFTQTTPSVNIVEAADAYHIEVAAPGLSKAEFDVQVDKDQLTISAETQTTDQEPTADPDADQPKSEDATANEPKFSRKGFNFSSFKRSFHLSDQVDKEGIKASYKHGILTVSVSKKEEAKEKEPTVIEIK